MKTENGEVAIELKFRNDSSSASAETETASMLEADKVIARQSWATKDDRRRHPRRIGNTFVFCYRKGRPLFTIGPHCTALYCSLPDHRAVLRRDERGDVLADLLGFKLCGPPGLAPPVPLRHLGVPPPILQLLPCVHSQPRVARKTPFSRRPALR